MRAAFHKQFENDEWAADRVAQLRRLWDDGLSAAQIAKTMGGISRAAVLGKAKRLHLDGRREPSKPSEVKPTPVRAIGPGRTSANPFGPQTVADVRERIERQEKVRAAIATGGALPPFTNVKSVSAAIALAPRPWLTRKTNECAWPVDGEGADTRSCCNRHADTGPYCEAHARVARSAVPPKAIKAPRYDGTARARA